MFRTLFIAGAIMMTMMSIPVEAGKYANAVAAAGGLQGRVLWCDAEANIWALDSREEVVDLVNHCKDANINAIVVDVKPLAGVVLYKSKIAPRLKEWQGKPYPKDYDLLKVMVEEGHKAGIEVHASINIFSEGAVNRDNSGPAYAHPEWQCVKYEVDRSVKGIDGNSYPITAVNAIPSPGTLGLITDIKLVPKTIAADAIYASIDANGSVISCGAKPQTIPTGGYVLLGAGSAAPWLSLTAQPGAKMPVEGKPRFIPMSESADEHLAVFVNPSNPAVRTYELSIVAEIAANYDVDGIVFDRMRYPGMYADFSECSKEAFEDWLGAKVERFPDDIFTIDPVSSGKIIRGKYFAKWMEWRAKQIRDFVSDARQIVKNTKPTMLVGAYVGSWYGSYYDVGVNWASPSFKPYYDWASPSYAQTGYADLMDWMCTGCYYEYPTRQDAKTAGASEAGSVEAAGQESTNVVMDDTFVYGSLYLLQYCRDPKAFERAIASCASTTQGVMLFDLVYIRDYNWWDILKRAFAKPARAPHSVPGLINKVKDVRNTVEQSGTS